MISFCQPLKKNTFYICFLLLHIKSTLDILLTISNIAIKVHLNDLLFIKKIRMAFKSADADFHYSKKYDVLWNKKLKIGRKKPKHS